MWPLVSFTSNTVEPRFLQFPTRRVKLSPCTSVENKSLQGAVCPAGSCEVRNMSSGISSTQRSSVQGAARHWGSRVGGGREVNPTLRPSPIRSSRNVDTPETRNSQSSRQATSHMFWSTGKNRRISQIKCINACLINKSHLSNIHVYFKRHYPGKPCMSKILKYSIQKSHYLNSGASYKLFHWLFLLFSVNIYT